MKTEVKSDQGMDVRTEVLGAAGARVGLVLDERFLQHRIDRASPENPERLNRVYHGVRQRFGDRFPRFSAREAGAGDVLAVHSEFYLEQLAEHCLRKDPYSYDRDTYLMEDSLIAAHLAAGGCIDLAERIVQGELESGFALIRPPGHHAEPGRGMGFCILNNVGITAHYLRSQHNYNRILILDYDAHHGNGTQEMFYETEEVLFISLHQRDIFPFSGTAAELGSGSGCGYTINIPVFPQFGDEEYTFLLGRLLQTVVEQYMPQFILVSAGYDGHVDDTISSLQLSTRWYSLVTTMLQQYAREYCDGRLMLVLEGGYNPVSLEASVLATLDSLLTPKRDRVGVFYSERGAKLLADHPLRDHWTLQV